MQLNSSGGSVATRFWRNAAGPFSTLAIALSLEVMRQSQISLPNPGTLFTLGVVLSLCVGGWWSGAASVLVAWTYNAYYFSKPGLPFRYTDDDLLRVGISSVVLPTLFVLVSVLKRNTSESERAAHEARLEATLAEQRHAAEATRRADLAVRESAMMREREQIIQRMAEATPAITYVFDVINRRSIYTNRRIADQLGYSAEQMRSIGEGNLANLLHPDDVARMPILMAQREAAKDGEVVEFVYRLRDARGEWRWFVGRDAVFTRTPEGRVQQVIGIAQEITDWKRAEEELRASRLRLMALSRRLLDVQETERRRLARELHDEIGQVLTAVEISLHTVKASVEPGASSPIDEALRIVDRAIQQVRDLSLDLRPSMLDDLGLEAAIRWHLDRQGRHVGVHTELASALAGKRFPPEIETACFRVVQEALTNVARYAGAKSVRVAIEERDGELEVVIEDDGIGFDAEAMMLRASRGGSFGIIGMCERVQLLGGRIEIDSTPGRGTRIRATFALLSAVTPEPGAHEESRVSA
jgi:PAS domain S-box-containing protein